MIETPRGRLGPEAERVFALALVLGLSPGRSWSRDALCELVWPDAAPRNARQNLRQALYRLRRMGVEVEASAGAISLHPNNVVSDTPTGTERTQEVSAAIISGERRMGPFLGTYEPDTSCALRDWLTEQRLHAHKILHHQLLTCATQEKAKGHWLLVESLTRQCLDLDALNEEATLLRAEAVAMMGGKFEAVSLLNAYAAEVASVSEDAALPARVLRRRVAEHSTPRQPKESSYTPMLGREVQLADFVGVLQSAKSRFGSAHLITGSAGVGKSRLLEEVTSFAELSGFASVKVTVNDGDSEQPVHLMFRLYPLLLECRGALGCNPTSLQFLRSLSNGHQPEIEHSGNADLALSKRNAIYRAVTDLCTAISEESPLLIAVDNLYKLDESSLSLLQYVGANTTGHRCVLICCTRTGGANGVATDASLEGFSTCQLSELPLMESLE